MVCISVYYANTPGKKFDAGYYAKTHLPLVMDRLRSFGMNRYEFDQGVTGPFIAIGRLYFRTLEDYEKGFKKHGDEIRGDVANYTDIAPEIQVSACAEG